jgi:magnesium-transporting ATPase (P-type)
MENIQTKSVKKTKKSPKQIVVFLAINVLAIFLLMAFTLWWQNDLSFLAFADGIWFVFAFQLTMAWSLFVYNQNIFTPLVHGVKTFFLLFLGRKPKEDYFHYYSKIKDNPIATPYIVVTFLLTLVILVVGILLTLEAY